MVVGDRNGAQEMKCLNKYKKAICIISICVLVFLRGIPVFAGDVPESLLYDDKALLFWGEVISYTKNDASGKNTISVLPKQKIKGDVRIDEEQAYPYCEPIGAFMPVKGKLYLMSYYDENNPLYVYLTTSTDLKTLKIKGIYGNAMMARFQEYLNAGEYEKKELERLDRLERLAQTENNPSNTFFALPVNIIGFVLIISILTIGYII